MWSITSQLILVTLLKNKSKTQWNRGDWVNLSKRSYLESFKWLILNTYSRVSQYHPTNFLLSVLTSNISLLSSASKDFLNLPLPKKINKIVFYQNKYFVSNVYKYTVVANLTKTIILKPKKFAKESTITKGRV